MRRVEEVLDLLLLGASFPEIRQFASAPERKPAPWRVCDRQLRRYVSKAYELLAERHDADRERMIHRHLAQRRGLYARAVAAGDLGTAARVLKDEAELFNLYPPKAVEVGGKNGGPVLVTLSPDERLAALARLRAAVGAGAGGGPPDGGNGTVHGKVLG
jgi:hypothetical protein